MITLIETICNLLGFRPNKQAQKGIPVGGVYALKMLGAPVTAPADTAQNNLWTVVLPPFGLNDRIEISLYFVVTSNTNSKTCTVTLDGTQIISVAITNANAALAVNFAIQNPNATNLVSVHNTGNTGATGVAGVFAIDTSTSKNLIIRGQKAVAGDTMTLQAAYIQLIEGQV
jgi:hypothetical protein